MKRKQKTTTQQLFDEIMKPVFALIVIVGMVGYGAIILLTFLQRHLVWVN